MQACTSTNFWCGPQHASFVVLLYACTVSHMQITQDWSADGQVVVGRTGDQTLTSESGDVTRYTSDRKLIKHVCFFTTPSAEMRLVPMQSPAGHVLQNSQDAGGWHEASVSFMKNYASVFLPLPESSPQLVSHFCNILTLDLAMHRYVFDGKPPALKKEELSRR